MAVYEKKWAIHSVENRVWFLENLKDYNFQKSSESQKSYVIPESDAPWM